MNIRDIIKSEVFSGILLIISLVIALIISNSIFYGYLLSIIYFPIHFELGNLETRTTFITVINHGLMTLFFLLIGLEMKHHLVDGQYQKRKKLILPFVAAVGGLIVPALIFYSLNYQAEVLNGWAIPIATDTAFVLAILSFFKRKISLDLRIFIIGFSLIDDFLAIIILTVFYSKAISLFALGVCLLLVVWLFILSYYEVRQVKYYLLSGVILWVFLEKAGIHGTLAGILVSLFIPVKTHDNAVSPLKRLEHQLTPYVNYFILPIFGLCNSELNCDNIVLDDLFTSLSLGILLGLFLGKQIGIFLFSYVSIKLKYCRLPENTSWLKFYAIAILGGIGFTLSLFIGGIAFNDQWSLNTVKSAVIISSFLSAVVGVILLRIIKDE